MSSQLSDICTNDSGTEHCDAGSDCSVHNIFTIKCMVSLLAGQQQFVDTVHEFCPPLVPLYTSI